jgi:hypothetical protein
MYRETISDNVIAVTLTVILLALFSASSILPQTPKWIIPYLTLVLMFLVPWIIIVSRPIADLLERLGK